MANEAPHDTQEEQQINADKITALCIGKKETGSDLKLNDVKKDIGLLYLEKSVVDPDPFLGLLDPDPLVRCTDPDSYCFVTSL